MNRRGQADRWRDDHTCGCTLPGSLLPFWLARCRSLEKAVHYRLMSWEARSVYTTRSHSPLSSTSGVSSPHHPPFSCIILCSPRHPPASPILLICHSSKTWFMRAFYATMSTTTQLAWLCFCCRHRLYAKKKSSKRGLKHCFIVVLSSTSWFQVLRPKVCYVNLPVVLCHLCLLVQLWHEPVLNTPLTLVTMSRLAASWLCLKHEELEGGAHIGCWALHPW